jgi:diguanylate cyclase (GGDEF)-like protein/PAS domain S-box-containing protein
MSYMSVPSNESARLAALRDLNVLDTPSDAAFDGLVKAASLICGVPISLVSLVDEHRQWFKANIGLNGITETPRDQAFCSHTILGNALLEIPDATQDERFANNPLVLCDPKIRFYAGMPLRLRGGQLVGSLCVIDRRPRRLNAAQRDVLASLADAAAAMLEHFQVAQRLRETAEKLQKSEEFLQQTGRLAGIGGWTIDLGSQTLNWTAETCHIHGVPPGYKPEIETAFAFFEPAARPIIRAAVQNSMAGSGPYDLELPFIRADGEQRWVRTLGDVVMENGKPIRLTGAIQDVTERVNEQKDMQLARERMALATESSGIGIWDWDMTDDTLHWNRRMFELYGMPPDTPNVTYANWAALLHPEDAEATQAVFSDALYEDRHFDLEFRIIWPDGSIRYLRSAGSITRDAEGKASRFIGVDWDVTESREMALELTSQHELMRTTLQAIGDGVITADKNGLLVWLNPVAERLTGWSAAEAVGRKVSDVYAIADEQSGARIACPVDLCLTAGGVARGSLAGGARAGDEPDPAQRRRLVLLARDGQRFGVEDLASPIRGDSGEIFGAVLVFHDVTEQRRVSSEMSYRATHDTLTGLLNRGEFETRLRFLLHKAHTENSMGSMLFIDLDQFKLVNDSCGHAAGDLLLVQVGRLMTDIVRSSDTVARLGGDEFAIILEGCAPEQAQGVAQEICDLLENYRFDHDGQRFRVGASIGLVPVDARWPAIAGIMQAADDSCYAAKEAGRNRVHAWCETDRAMRERQSEMQWAARLTRALDEDHFELFAQRLKPLQKIDESVHAEVLLRLREADGTLSTPGIFIPAAERFHLASRIDRWVLRRAIDWMNSAAIGEIAMLSVNLSGQSVGDRAFHRWAIAVLEAAGPRVCQRLCLEITETAAVTNLADASIFIQQVRKVGVRVALDDFGAGASSFGYLKTLSVDFLKIDGQFVRDLETDPLDQAAVRCFVDVASKLGIKTVAEYVDKPNVLRTLRVMGVDLAQGFLIHKPAPIAELLAPVAPARQARLSAVAGMG